MNIIEISVSEALPLRNKILRPGKDASECVFLGDDDPDTKHFGAVGAGNKIAGIVSVYRKQHPDIVETNCYQLRGMATDPSARGTGVGRLLLVSVEEYVRSRGSKAIWANSRRSALGFYVKSGYKVISGEFDIEGIGPHYLVAKPVA